MVVLWLWCFLLHSFTYSVQVLLWSWYLWVGVSCNYTIRCIQVTFVRAIFFYSTYPKWWIKNVHHVYFCFLCFYSIMKGLLIFLNATYKQHLFNSAYLPSIQKLCSCVQHVFSVTWTQLRNLKNFKLKERSFLTCTDDFIVALKVP